MISDLGPSSLANLWVSYLTATIIPVNRLRDICEITSNPFTLLFGTPWDARHTYLRVAPSFLTYTLTVIQLPALSPVE